MSNVPYFEGFKKREAVWLIRADKCEAMGDFKGMAKALAKAHMITRGMLESYAVKLGLDPSEAERNEVYLEERENLEAWLVKHEQNGIPDQS